MTAYRPASEFAAANARYWFEHELRQYPAVALDHDELRRNADRLVLGVGTDSRSYPAHEATVRLAEKLSLRPFELPGGHLGFAAQPSDFANSPRVVPGLTSQARRTQGADWVTDRARLR